MANPNIAARAPSIKSAADQRAIIFDKLAVQNRDATPAEQLRLYALEDALAYGTPRTAEDVAAQVAYVNEVSELIEDGADTRADNLRACAAAKSALAALAAMVA